MNGVFGMDDLCLILRKVPTNSPGFEIKSVDCNEKKSVICKTNFLAKAPVPKPSRFPCILDSTNVQQNQLNRKKRANSMTGIHFFRILAGPPLLS